MLSVTFDFLNISKTYMYNWRKINRCIFAWQGVQKNLPRSCTSHLNPILVTTIPVIQDCKITQIVQSNSIFVT